MAVSVDMQTIERAEYRAHDGFEIVRAFDDKGACVTMYFDANSGAKAVADVINAAVAGDVPA